MEPQSLEKFLKRKYRFRKNVVTDRTEFREIKKDKSFKLLTEWDLNSIYRECALAEKKCTLIFLKTLLNSNFVEREDPFLMYFDDLEQWDESQPDYISLLANEVTINEPELNNIWQDYFKRWIVSSVACTLDEEKTNHQVLVIVGKQGLGKSSFLKKLIPESLKNYIYTGNVDPNNKDTLVHLAENMFINLDELENLNKTELGNLKALITQSDIKLRRAYAAFNENLRRRASFMGSVNDAEFLTDSTGNRRYLIFTCDDINYEHKINMDKVYSQAYYLFKFKKIKYHFDKEDIPKLEVLNSGYLRVSTEEDLLMKYFRPATRDMEDCLELTPVEILREIEKEEGAKMFDNYTSPRRVGQALQKHNYIKISKYNRKPYKLIKIFTNYEEEEATKGNNKYMPKLAQVTPYSHPNEELEDEHRENSAETENRFAKIESMDQPLQAISKSKFYQYAYDDNLADRISNAEIDILEYAEKLEEELRISEKTQELISKSKKPYNEFCGLAFSSLMDYHTKRYQVENDYISDDQLYWLIHQFTNVLSSFESFEDAEDKIRTIFVNFKIKAMNEFNFQTVINDIKERRKGNIEEKIINEDS